MTELAYQTKLSAGIDLYCQETVRLDFMKWPATLIKTGTYVRDLIPSINEDVKDAELPSLVTQFGPIECVPYFQLQVRSSLGVKGMVMPNAPGIIDVDYPDEILVPLVNMGYAGNSDRFIESYTIEKGERVAQLIYCLSPRIDNVEVKDVERGGGFGSTGLRELTE